MRKANEFQANLGCSSCLVRSILQPIDCREFLSIGACSCIHQAVHKCPLDSQVCRWLEVRFKRSIEDSRVEQAAPVQPSVQTSQRVPVAVGLQVQTSDAVQYPFTHSGSQAAEQSEKKKNRQSYASDSRFPANRHSKFACRQHARSPLGCTSQRASAGSAWDSRSGLQCQRGIPTRHLRTSTRLRQQPLSEM
jgi:hypothetical protein